MNIRLGIFILFIVLTNQVWAGKPGTLQSYSSPIFAHSGETKPKSTIWQRVYYGGNVGLQFGNPVSILLSPALGYVPKTEFLKGRLMYGLGGTYMYYNLKIYDQNYVSSIYGGRLYVRYMLSNNVYAYMEYENLNAPYYKDDGTATREWVPGFFVGGGYLTRFSNRGGGMMISALYNLAWLPNNLIYTSPWNIRVGIML